MTQVRRYVNPCEYNQIHFICNYAFCICSMSSLFWKPDVDSVARFPFWAIWMCFTVNVSIMGAVEFPCRLIWPQIRECRLAWPQCIQSHSFLSRLSLTHTHTRPPHTTPPPMSLTCMLHSLDRHTVGNQNIITLSHTAANSGVATIQNSRAALTLNFHMKVGATKYRPAGRNWPASLRPLI